MARIRLVLALLALTMAIGLAPASAQEETPAGEEAPAVVVDDAPAPINDEAWTFRFLVPTVLALSGLALVVTVVVYGVRVRGRYRVAR
jgi:hypothetical protein